MPGGSRTGHRPKTHSNECAYERPRVGQCLHIRDSVGICLQKNQHRPTNKYGTSLIKGTKIDSSLGFADTWGADFDPGLTDHYVGIRLWANDTEGFYNYGWACISTSEDGLSATLNGIAFESDINTAINAGDTGMSAVPEPGNMLSLAALVGSAAFLRTRRKAAATAA